MTSQSKAVIPKVCSVDRWWSASLAEVVRESHINQCFDHCGPPNFCKWSANQKSLGSTGLREKEYQGFCNDSFVLKSSMIGAGVSEIFKICVTSCKDDPIFLQQNHFRVDFKHMS